jgi:hypothetical protein
MIYISGFLGGVEEPSILWDDLLGKGTLTASSALADGAGANAAYDGTTDRWRPSAMPATLAVTLSGAAHADSAAIVGHNLGTAGATLFVEHWSGAAWVVSATVSPSDNSPLLLVFARALSDQWRMRITGAALIYMARAMIGKRLIVPGGVVPPYVPLNLAEEIELLDGGQSRNGQHIPSPIQRVGGAGSIDIMPQEWEWVTGPEFDGFRRHFNRGNAFFFAASPACYPDDISYCRRDGRELQPSFQNAFLMSISMGVRVYVG